MALVNIATITNASKELQDMIIKRFEQSEILENNAIWVRSKRLELHNLLLEVSKEQDDIIKVYHSFSAEQYSRSYVTEYYKGDYEIVELEINYGFNDFKVPDKFNKEDIKDKVIEAFRVYDRVVKRDDGFYVYIGDVGLPFSFILDKDYKVEAVKNYNMILVTVFKKVTEWQPIE